MAGHPRFAATRIITLKSDLSAARHANMCSMPSPPAPVVRARLDRALASRDLAAVRAAARDLPRIVTLTDAVQVLVLMLDSDDPAFESAAVRWIARFTRECPGSSLGEV